MGYVYILTTSCMPGIIKVGFTERKPHERAAELSRATGVALPFAVAWARQCVNPRACEAAVHHALRKYRVNSKREFFRCDVASAVKEINRAADDYLRRRYHKPVNWSHAVRYLYLAAAVFGFIAVLTRPHASMWWIMEKGTWVVIALGHLSGHHHGYY